MAGHRVGAMPSDPGKKLFAGKSGKET